MNWASLSSPTFFARFIQNINRIFQTLPQESRWWVNIPMKSSMLSNFNEALSQNAFSLVPLLFSMNAASSGLKQALKMDGSNGMIQYF